MIVGHCGGGSGPYKIPYSLRFRNTVQAHLHRTLSSTSANPRTWTLSFWVKRGKLTTTQHLSSAGAPTLSPWETTLRFSNAGDDKLEFTWNGNSSGGGDRWTSSALFRDPSAWYHIVLKADIANSTRNSRLTLYVNGKVSPFNPVGNASNSATTAWLNSAYPLYIGKRSWTTGEELDAYLADVYLIDGLGLDADEFGEYDNNGVWVPKQYSGSYGANGFFLNFRDGINLTSLGYDESGNNNDFTSSGHSITSGSTYDWMKDTPTNNFATINPLPPFLSAGMSILHANMMITGVANADSTSLLGTEEITGKVYFEVDAVANNGYGQSGIGVSNATKTSYVVKWIGAGGDYSTYGKYGIAIDKATGSVWFRNTAGAWITGDPVDGTSPTATLSMSSEPFFPLIGLARTTGFTNVGSIYVNFGQQPFTYSPPAGFKSLCTKNLPAVSITNPKKHFDVLLHTGNGAASQSVTGTQFQPNLSWSKCRSNVDNHSIIDTLRGITKVLQPNTTSAEFTSDVLDSFDSNGFTADLNLNVLGRTYASWLWKAGGAGVTNTAGSTTSTVSANPQAGLSIVTVFTNGSGVVPSCEHGLGAAPGMIIMRPRTGIDGWYVYHKDASIPATRASLLLNTSAAINTVNGFDGTTDKWTVGPTTFGLGNTIWYYQTNTEHVAYCFTEIPGFSRIGSFTGNGSTDGPFVYCGFRPRYILSKCYSHSSASTLWTIHDTERDQYNAAVKELDANTSDAEFTDTHGLDILSNGFKPRRASDYLNTAGWSYIFIAFAEHPFGGSNVSATPAR